MRYLRYLLLALAAVGFATSVAINLLSWLNLWYADVVLLFPLFAGAFVIWFSADKISQFRFGHFSNQSIWRTVWRWYPLGIRAATIVLIVLAVVNFFAAPYFFGNATGPRASDDVMFMTMAGGHLAFMYFTAFALLHAVHAAETAAAGAEPLIPAGSKGESGLGVALARGTSVAPVAPRRPITPRFLANLAVRLKPFSRRLTILSFLSLFGFFPLIIYTFAALQNDVLFLLSLVGWLFGFTWPNALSGIASAFDPDNEDLLLRSAAISQNKVTNARAYFVFVVSVSMTLFWFLYPIIVLSFIFLRAGGG